MKNETDIIKVIDFLEYLLELVEEQPETKQLPISCAIPRSEGYLRCMPEKMYIASKNDKNIAMVFELSDYEDLKKVAEGNEYLN